MLKLIGQLLYVVGKALGGTIGGSKKAEIEPCGLVDVNEASDERTVFIPPAFRCDCICSHALFSADILL